MQKLGMLGAVMLLVSAATVSIVHAVNPPSDFYLEVSPSPLVTTVKPGQQKDIELAIRNAGTGTEELKIESRRFTINNATGQVDLDDTAQPEISSWISFSSPTFTIKPGEVHTEKIKMNVPKGAGFSYSFALVISRTQNPKATESGRLIKGSVAVFVLMNVDRPGAVRKVEVQKFSTTAGIYEYLPATLNIQFKNTGNTIVQPYGNIFIQRDSNDSLPIATLPVNDKKGYILPGSERTLMTDWSEGFPTYQITTGADGKEQRAETWDWSQLSHFRIGRYTAKLVAVYNDGKHDVPIEQEVTFWVLPWKIILGAIVVLVLVVLGLWTFVRRVWKLLRHGKKHPSKSDS
jgi:hypothetical protein